MSDVIGESSGRGRTFAIVGGAIGMMVLVGVIAWAAKRRDPSTLPPTGTVSATTNGCTLTITRFDIAERTSTFVLDVPSNMFNAAMFALERDSRLWMTYGGVEYPALSIQAARVHRPEDSPTVRIVLTGSHGKDKPVPDPKLPIKAGIQIPGDLVRLQQPLRILIEGVEKGRVVR